MMYAQLLLVLAGTLLWAAETPDYRGSSACEPCHRSIYRSYLQTGMGRSMSLASSDITQAEVVQRDRGLIYRVYVKNGAPYQSESGVDTSGKTIFRTWRKLEFAIGSGTNGRTYLIRRGDYLFQAPLTWYSKAQKWDLSPGYELSGAGFNRPIAAACIYCHSGRPQPVEDREGLFQNPPFRELAIGCENCHGPGSMHIQSGGMARWIVNPARLSPRLAEQICIRCHQGGDARVLQPGKHYDDIRPGFWLDDSLAIFKLASHKADNDLLEHFAAMQASRCFRASAGKLSCLTCHDPHVEPAAADRPAYYRARCLTCHQDANCELPIAKRARNGNNCIACHMPKRAVATVSHAALTNHRIERVPGSAPQARAKDATNLGIIHVNRRPDSITDAIPPLTLLRAYGELMSKDNSLVPRYLALLEKLAKEQPDNPMVSAALGSLELRKGSGDAVEHLSRAIDHGYIAGPVFEDLAEALARAGRQEEAMAVLQRGISVQLYRPTLYKSLVLRYIQLRRYADAESAMRHYLDLFPEDSFMHGLLDRISASEAKP